MISSRPVRRKKRERKRSVSRGSYTYQAAMPQVGAQLSQGAPDRVLPWNKVPDLVLLVFLVALLIFFFADNRFYVPDVTLSGNRLVSASEIAEVTHIRDWSVFYINRQQLKQAILKSFPSVRDVQVRCRFPAAVHLEIIEREPQIIWEGKGGRFLASADGLLLKAAPEAKDLLLIRDHSGQALKAGAKVERQAIQTAQELQTLLPNTRAFDYTAERGVALAGPGGYPVYFGLGGNLQVKVINMEALIRELQRQGQSNIEYIDVRFDTRPLYRQVGGQNQSAR